ncbi:hypothetical protein ACUOA5_25655, partial [Escherichia coli]
VSENAPEAFVALMAKHYHRLKAVKDYQEIDDVLFKFSLIGVLCVTLLLHCYGFIFEPGAHL